MSFQLATQILHVVSRRQSLSWGHYKKTFDVLRARDGQSKDERISPSNERHQISVVLGSLGHADFWFGENPRVQACPPTLVRLPQGGFPRAVLCGARDEGTRAELETACRKCGAFLENAPRRSHALAPEPFLLRAPHLENLENVARELGIAWRAIPAAWECAQNAPNVQTQLETARRTLGGPPGEGWRAYRFDAARCTFEPHDLNFAQNAQSGDFVKWVPVAGGLNRFHFLEKRNENDLNWLALDLDWGRYAALHAQNRRALIYDEKKSLLAVPEGAPLPSLLARAAALSCGVAPALVATDFALGWPTRARDENAPRWNLYRDVPKAIANLICQKLGQKPLDSNPQISQILQQKLAQF